jgi:hypothetical protein
MDANAFMKQEENMTLKEKRQAFRSNPNIDTAGDYLEAASNVLENGFVGFDDDVAAEVQFWLDNDRLLIQPDQMR